MVVVSATAEIRGACIHGQDGNSDSTVFESFAHLFAASSGERATKRRKLHSGKSAASHPSSSIDEDKSVVLAKVSLELHLPGGQAEQLSTAHNPDDPLDVSLESFTKTAAGEFALTLCNPQNGPCIVDLDGVTSSDSLDLIHPHLRVIASDLCKTVDGRKRSQKTRAAFGRCLLVPSTAGQSFFRLEVEIRWVLGLPVAETAMAQFAKKDLKILSTYFPDFSAGSDTPWGLSDFYTSVHVPRDDIAIPARIRNILPDTTLYPFQQRAVDWLLRREGVAYSADATDHTDTIEGSSHFPVSLRPTHDVTGRPCYVSLIRGLIVTDLGAINDSSRTLRGGILAEEMGLGKTVELLALMCLHERRIPEGDVFDAYTGSFVHPSGATLIISPPSILEQWHNEIRRHAPSLRVFHYKGLPAPSAPKKEHEAATVENLLQYDVVLTTYSVLSREVHFAKPPPDRSLRYEKQHESRKSPLVQISWWRVCLDEAQMVESGVSQAATVARIIPRCNAWAVSGTPLRKDVQDLRGLLTFLRYEPFAGSKPVWDRLDKTSFQEIFGQLAMRHTKDKIREELRLPPQKRVVITVPFTAIEEQNYAEMMRQMCEACGLTPEGLPTREDRDTGHPEVIERMREWLVRLRQTCLHAHVGRKNRKALGAKNGPLRTIHEVLEVMIEQVDASVKSEAREFILEQMTCGHIKANAKNVESRSETALPFYEQALKDAQHYVQLCRDELLAEEKRLGRSVSENEQDFDEDEEDKDGQEVGRIPIIRRSLRSFLELEHACKFWIGTMHYQIKANENLTKPDTEEFHQREKLEVQWYDEAKKIRKELLRQSQRRAQLHMNRISSKKPFYQIPKIADLPELGGIEGKKILDVMDEVTDLLNAQKEQIEKYRRKVVDILMLPLVDEDEGKETTGDEYEDSTKVQDELYVYQLALRAAVADRQATANGMPDGLIEHELQEAEKQALRKQGHAPELVLEVVNARRKLLPSTETGSLKGVISSTRSLLNALEWRADSGDGRAAAEVDILQKQLAKIQSIANDHGKGLVELVKEQELFRAAMNQRLEFYRQLQHVSDTVAPYKEELDEVFNERAFNARERGREQRKRAVAGHKNKHNYLVNLRHENAQMDVKHECIICQDVFEIGVLTSCGHKYCKDCINHWWHAHRTCPLCKVKLYSSDFTDITLKPSTMKAQEEVHDEGNPSQPCTPESSTTSIYSDISDTTMKEIKTIDLDGSYGTKVDMIARHLLWIRHNDPSAKSIVFSQFSDFLSVLREALRNWKIGATSISDKSGIANFRSDPSIECFLLDAKSDSSGLNLVNATYVFLCEPLINPAIELQAIARVHRIGQKRMTTVFMYLVGDTVEEAIYDISVARRLEHMGRSSSNSGFGSALDSKPVSGTTTPAPVPAPVLKLQEQTIEQANSMELEAAPLKQLLRKKGDGEIVQVNDLWSCLFGKVRKPLNERKSKVLDEEVGRHLRAQAAERRILEGEMGGEMDGEGGVEVEGGGVLV